MRGTTECGGEGKSSGIALLESRDGADGFASVTVCAPPELATAAPGGSPPARGQV